MKSPDLAKTTPSVKKNILAFRPIAIVVSTRCKRDEICSSSGPTYIKTESHLADSYSPINQHPAPIHNNLGRPAILQIIPRVEALVRLKRVLNFSSVKLTLSLITFIIGTMFMQVWGMAADSIL